MTLVSADGSETTWNTEEASAASQLLANALGCREHLRISVAESETSSIVDLCLRVASIACPERRSAALSDLDGDRLSALANAANYLDAPLALDAAVAEMAKRLRGARRSDAREALGVESDDVDVGATGTAETAQARESEWID